MMPKLLRPPLTLGVTIQAMELQSYLTSWHILESSNTLYRQDHSLSPTNQQVKKSLQCSVMKATQRLIFTYGNQV